MFYSPLLCPDPCSAYILRLTPALLMASKMNTKYKKALELSQGVSPNYNQAYTYLKSAAEEEDDQAIYALATWYLFGRHVRKNLSKAARLLRSASDLGNTNATYDLAVCYEDGAGVKKNLPMAFRLYMKAAIRGDNQSVAEVGRLYYYGIGVEKNRKLANIWLDRAEELGVN